MLGVTCKKHSARWYRTRTHWYSTADPRKPVRAKNLGFGIVPVSGHVRYTWKRGEGWDDGQVLTSPYMNLHVNAGVLHYGLSVFEGLKAFESPTGEHLICNPKANARRMRAGAERLMMPDVPDDIFVSAVTEAVSLNREHVPSYESGGSLYIRPLLFASGSMLPLKITDQFSFVVTVTPVGNYFSENATGISAAVVPLDRAAPRGTGAVKAGGNYASDMYGLHLANERGCDTSLYLDPLENRFIEEFSVANFVGIREGKYVTPDTPSVLPSITNKMLIQLAKDAGIDVEVRPIDFKEEISSFTEVAGSGTAVVLSPCSRILDQNGNEHTFGQLSTLGSLRDRLVRIQRGEESDVFNWMHSVTPMMKTMHQVDEDPERVLRNVLCAVSSGELQAELRSHISQSDNTQNKLAVNDTQGKVVNKYTDEATLKRMYDRLAGSYHKAGGDRIVAAAHCSSLLLHHLPVSRRGRVLDAGAGTGEAGSVLKEAGFRHLTAYDLSDNMLDYARKRGVYDVAIQGCLPDSPFNDAHFDAIVCAGCLAPGHASPATYAEFCRILRPGGLVAFSIPRTYYESIEGQGHRFAIETLRRVRAWEHIFEEKRSYFDEVEAMYFVFRRLESAPSQSQEDRAYLATEKERQSFYVFP